MLFPWLVYEFTVILYIYYYTYLNFCIHLYHRVQCYIKYGRDQYLVDPDKGGNSQIKLAAAQNPQSLTFKLLQSLPTENDPLWEYRLYRISKTTFSTIYDFLVDRKTSQLCTWSASLINGQKRSIPSQKETKEKLIYIRKKEGLPKNGTKFQGTNSGVIVFMCP